MFLFKQADKGPKTHTFKLEIDRTNSNKATCHIQLHAPSDLHFNQEAPNEHRLTLTNPEWKLVQTGSYGEHVIDIKAELEAVGSGSQQLQAVVTYFTCTDDMSNCYPPVDVTINVDVVEIAGASGVAKFDVNL